MAEAAVGMSQDEMHARLEGIAEALENQFPGSHARLEQLSSHLATVGMVIDHIFDEAERG